MKITPTRSVIIFFGLVMIAVLVGATLTLHLLRKQETDLWFRQLDNLSLLMAENTAQIMSTANLVLDEIVEHVVEEKASDAITLRKKMGTSNIHGMLRERLVGLPHIDVASIVADSGDVINSTRSYPAPAINLADRDYFQAHLRNPKLGRSISVPVRNRTNGKWVFFLTRRIEGRDGQFLGIVLVGMSIEVLTSFYEKIGQNLGEGTTINLFRRDFTRLTRWPQVEAEIGKQVLNGVVYNAVEVMKKDHDVRYVDSARLIGLQPVPRLFATRVLERYPLIVSLSVTEDIYLASWRQARWMVLILSGISFMAMLIVFVYLFKIMRQREADTELNLQLRLKAEAASDAKSQFLSSMSHELRTPLNAVLGFSQLLVMDPELAKEHRENAKEIERAGQHLLALITDLLDLSRIESGKIDLTPRAVMVGTLVRDCLDLLATKAREAGVALIDEGGPGKDAVILVDPIRMRQIMLNFLSNAIKYTHAQGSVGVSYELQDGLVRVAVKDTGSGIPAAKQERLFTAFDRLGAENSAIEGSGIGLVITKRLVEAMGGRLGFESVEGVGSTFWVAFPSQETVIPQNAS